MSLPKREAGVDASVDEIQKSLSGSRRPREAPKYSLKAAEEEDEGAPAGRKTPERKQAGRNKNAGLRNRRPPDPSAQLEEMAADVANLVAAGSPPSFADGLADHEREYVEQTAAGLLAAAKRRKKMKVAEKRQRVEEARRRGSPAEALRKLKKHPFWTGLARRYTHERKVPVMRQAVVIERWTYYITDNLAERTLLSQLVFWFKLNRIYRIRARLVTRDDEFEVAKTDDEMSDEIGVPTRTIARHRASLIRRGLIRVRRALFKGLRTCHYTIDWDALEEAFVDGGGDLRGFIPPAELAVTDERVVEHLMDDDDDD